MAAADPAAADCLLWCVFDLKIPGMGDPIIGISVDNRDNTAASGRYESPVAYSRCVAASGGVPLLLPHEPDLAGRYVEACDGLVLTGGVDPATEAFGQPMHPQARPMDAGRQAFELALLDAADCQPDKPVLGICLGMQLMALRARARLHQYLPDVLDDALVHQDDNRHGVALCVDRSTLFDGPLEGDDLIVVSWHRQAVSAEGDGGGGAAHVARNTHGGRCGRLRVVAVAHDGVVEAVDDPGRAFYVGVQWHPERGGDGPLNRGLFDRFVAACRSAT